MNISNQAIEPILNWLRQNAAGAALCANSRQLASGDVFIALLTRHGDGRQYIAQAIERGARAIVYEADGFDWQPEWQLAHLPVSGLSGLAAELAAAWYQHPGADMLNVAVTGTNGKTSCSQWIARVLSMLGQDSAVIGTLGVGLYRNGQAPELSETGFTTPDAIQLQSALADLQAAGAKALAIEASSIGLEQGRMQGLPVKVAVFTNLTRDHLDYHGDMQNYGRAKQILFDWPDLQAAVINLDDDFGLQLLQHLKQQRPQLALFGYTVQTTRQQIDGVQLIRASNFKTTHAGTSFHLDSPAGSALVKTRLIGRFNISNVLAVIGVMLSQQLNLSKVLAAVEKLTPVPGRMQLLGNPGHVMVVIDYAHTPDALEKTLQTLRQVADERHGRLWCVFGCGGDRDPGKRPQMGRIAEQADQVVVTSDNPRTEDPAVIISQIVAGMSGAPQVIEDRAKAILSAIKHAADSDVILLAGKGHETYQDINGKKWPFSDEQHASLALATVATHGNMKRSG